MTRPSPHDAEGGACPRCGAAYEPMQEYCLDCGSRLPPAGGLGSMLGRAWRVRVSSYPGGRLWLVLALLVVAGLATVGAIVASDEDASAVRTIVATEPEPTTTLPVVQTAPELPTAPTTAATEPETAPSTRPAAPVEWPAGRSGFTVVVSSAPATRGREHALRQARAAIRAGLPSVGVLDSSAFASLRPGYFVIFSGYYRSIDAARAAVESAQENGYPKAYEREIAP